jgi:hypothetical protein
MCWKDSPSYINCSFKEGTISTFKHYYLDNHHRIFSSNLTNAVYIFPQLLEDIADCMMYIEFKKAPVCVNKLYCECRNGSCYIDNVVDVSYLKKR